MRRLLLSVSLVFVFAGMCGGGGEAENDDPVVVPVAEDDAADEDGDEGSWCCEYKDEDGGTQYALTEGPAECNTKYADNDGRWISGNQCIPCCCKAPNDPEDAEKGHAYELTTPKSCIAGSGECMVADSEECAAEEEEAKEKAAPRPRPRPKPRTVTKPGSR